MLLAGTGEATEFSVLLHSSADPVDLRVTSDGLVEGIDADDLKVKQIFMLTHVKYFEKL